MSEELLLVTKDIPVNNGTVYAYRVGDKVSAAAVKANKWEDYVESPKTSVAPAGKKEN